MPEVMEKVSILTSCYNSRPFLEGCAKSILGQNYGDFEWVVVDDFSDDGSYEYLRSLQDSRVKLLRNDKRMYCASSYNRAVQECSGDICGVVDSDDALVAGSIETLVKLYQKYPSIGYIYTQHYWCDKHMNIKKKGVSCLPKGNRSFIDMALKYNSHCCSHWRTFRKKLASQSVLFRPGLKYAVDKYFAFTVEEIAMGGFYPEPLYYYRYHSKNMSKTKASEQGDSCRKLAKEFTKSKKRRVLPVTQIK